MNYIYAWLYHNLLIINVRKTVYITFGNYCDSIPAEDDTTVTINDQELQRVDSCKYLGVVYDKNIKCNVTLTK